MRVGEMVLEFHETYDCARPGEFVPTLDPELAQVREDIFEEEYREYREAVEAGDIVAVADAIGDMLYILYGHAIAHGIRNMDDVVAEIHRSNMTKLGEDGKPIFRADGKVLKGPHYEGPRIAELLGLPS